MEVPGASHLFALLVGGVQDADNVLVGGGAGVSKAAGVLRAAGREDGPRGQLRTVSGWQAAGLKGWGKEEARREGAASALAASTPNPSENIICTSQILPLISEHPPT